MWRFLYKNLNNPINLFIEMKSITLKALKNGKIKRKPSHSAYPTSTFESNLCSNIHFSRLFKPRIYLKFWLELFSLL